MKNILPYLKDFLFYKGKGQPVSIIEKMSYVFLIYIIVVVVFGFKYSNIYDNDQSSFSINSEIKARNYRVYVNSLLAEPVQRA
jgi:cell division protein FtsL